MRKEILILTAVMVILASFAFVKAEGLNETNQTLPWISPSVYEEFNKSEWVNVGAIVDSNESLEAIISSLPESDFQLAGKSSSYLFYFWGNMTRKSLSILANNSHIGRIEYMRVSYLAANNPQNQSCIPSVFFGSSALEALKTSESVYVGVAIKNPSWIIIDENAPIEEIRKQVNLREEYKKNISEQIRANLTPDEFIVTRVSIDGTIFFGRITKKGVEKLNGSCYVKNIVIPLTGSGAGNQENQTLPYVDPEILKAFENNQTWVYVFVKLIDTSNITISGSYKEIANLSQQRSDFLRARVDNFLTGFSDNEIRNIRKYNGEFVAEVTLGGFERLSNDPRVLSIILAYNASAGGNSNILDTENKTEVNRNQTEIKNPEVAKPLSFFQKILSFFKRLFRWK